MPHVLLILLHLLSKLGKLIRPGGAKSLVAENIVLKQQLLILRRSRRRAPNLRSADRVLFGLCSQLLSPRRLLRSAIILKPATLLRFHRAFKDFKYRFLYSSGSRSRPGPKGPSPELIRAICELKRRNPDLAARSSRSTWPRLLASTSTKMWSAEFWPPTTDPQAGIADL